VPSAPGVKKNQLNIVVLKEANIICPKSLTCSKEEIKLRAKYIKKYVVKPEITTQIATNVIYLSLNKEKASFLNSDFLIYSFSICSCVKYLSLRILLNQL
jgi:hypothetical protein